MKRSDYVKQAKWMEIDEIIDTVRRDETPVIPTTPDNRDYRQGEYEYDIPTGRYDGGIGNENGTGYRDGVVPEEKYFDKKLIAEIFKSCIARGIATSDERESNTEPSRIVAVASSQNVSERAR